MITEAHLRQTKHGAVIVDATCARQVVPRTDTLMWTGSSLLLQLPMRYVTYHGCHGGAGRRFGVGCVDDSGSRPPGSSPLASGGEHPYRGGFLIPRQLPGPPIHFVNRNDELSLLDAKLHAQRRRPSIVVIKGAGGMGKSAVALQWLHHRASDFFPDGQLYAVLAQAAGDPVAVEDVLGGFLRALGMAPDRIPPTLADRAALYRSVTADRSMAVLLEDAVSAAQVKALLPGSATSVVAVTSRRALPGLLADGAAVVSLDPLDEASSADLLRRHVGDERVEAEREPTRALVTLCGGMPIALCVMAAHMLLRPNRPAARLVNELRDERRRLDVLAVEDDLSVRSTFDVSLRALSGEAPHRRSTSTTDGRPQDHFVRCS